MIISNTYRFIFVHIHKTAGTAVTHALEPHLRWSDVVLGSIYGEPFNTAFRARFGVHKHSYAADIRDCLGDEVWHDYVTFTVVRDPVARAMSLYRWLGGKVLSQTPIQRVKRLTGYYEHPRWNWPDMRAYLRARDFSAFIRDPLFLEAPGAQPQHNWVTDPATGTILVDEILRHETIAEEFPAFLTRHGLPPSPLKSHNVSKLSVPVSLSADDAAYLRELYARDYALFYPEHAEI